MKITITIKYFGVHENCSGMVVYGSGFEIDHDPYGCCMHEAMNIHPYPVAVCYSDTSLTLFRKPISMCGCLISCLMT